MNKDGECNNGFGTQGEKKEGDPIKRYSLHTGNSSRFGQGLGQTLGI